MDFRYFVMDENRVVHEVDEATAMKGYVSEYENRVVAKTPIGGYAVSTMFRRFSAEDPPQPFETMVYRGDVPAEGFPRFNYSTYDEALSGHLRMCDKVRSGLLVVCD